MGVWVWARERHLGVEQSWTHCLGSVSPAASMAAQHVECRVARSDNARASPLGPVQELRHIGRCQIKLGRANAQRFAGTCESYMDTCGDFFLTKSVKGIHGGRS